MATITFTEALNRAEYGKFNVIIIILGGVILAHVMWETTSVSFFMTVAECDLSLTDTRKGMLSGISSVGILISLHMWGFLCDTQGRKYIMKFALVTGFIITFLSSFAGDFNTMLILRFLNGICVSAPSATVFAFIGEFHTDHTRTRAVMLSSVVFGMGCACMPIVAFAIINNYWHFYIPVLDLEYKPWRLYLLLCGLPGFISGIVMFYLPETPKFLVTMNRQEEAKEALQQMYLINGGEDDLELPDISLDEDEMEEHETDDTLFGFLMSVWHQTAPLFRDEYLLRTVIVSVTQFWLYVIAFGFFMWFPYIFNTMAEYKKQNPDGSKRMCEILKSSDGMTSKYGFEDPIVKDSSWSCPDILEGATYLYSVLLQICFIISFSIISAIVNRVGKIPIICTIIVVFSSCGILAVTIPNSGIAAIFFTALFLVGVSINVLGTITIDLYPTQLRAMAVSVSFILGRFGVIMGTTFVGALISTQCELTFYIGCLAVMSCAALLLLLPQDTDIE